MTNLFEQFQQFRRILCVCPCCGDLVRVSDLGLKAKGSAVRTWLDDYELKENRLSRKEEGFEEKERTLREIARKKGREEAEKTFERAICPSLKTLELDSHDIKPILHPIDFVVFSGMTKEETISDIILLSKSSCPSLNLIRHDIKTAVTRNRYNWEVARIDEKGNITFD